MNKFEEIIEMKKQKSASRKPRYGTRKLSIGLVSCVLGFTMLVSPSISLADEATDQKQPNAIEDTASPKDGAYKKESITAENTSEVKTDDETPKANQDVQPTEESLNADETSQNGEKTETNNNGTETPLAEENDPKEEAPAEELAKKEEPVASEDEKALEEEKKEEEPAVKEDTLEVSDQEDPKVLKAGATSGETKREPKDISNEIQDRQVHLNTEKLIADENARITEENKKRPSFDQKPLIPEEGPAHIHPDEGEPIGYEVAFTSPRGSIGGDHFTVKLSDTLKIQGIEPYTTKADPLVVGDKTIATGERLDNQTIKYTFTDEINDIRNVRVSIKGYAYVNKAKVPNSKDETFSVALGDKKDEKTIKVDYGEVYYTGDNLNGKSQITEYNPETGEFTQVFYINPDGKKITNSTKDIFSGKVMLFIDGKDDQKNAQSDVSYNSGNTTVSVQKLAPGTKVTDAILEKPVSDEQTNDANVRTTFRDKGIEIVFSDILGNDLPTQGIISPYIVTVKSKIPAGPDKKDVNLKSRGTLYGDGNNFHIMNNEIVSVVGDNEAQGQQVGYFIEHHVYKTKVDGVLQEDKTFTIDSNKMEGADYDDYFTDKSEIEDFKFVEIDTTKIKEGAAYKEDGSIARGSYKPGKTQEVTYIYERDIKRGSFQEHHIYQSLDEDGNVVAEETVKWNSDETTGFDETSYDTSKKDKDKNPVTSEEDNYGYKLVKVEASGNSAKKDEVKFDSTGAETTGNYVNGEKLEVTYTYQKKVTTKGAFKEHHIYQTVDEDGNVISTDDNLKKDSESTGKEAEEFTTQKKDEEGYTLVKVEGTEGTNFNQEGTAKKTNYKKGETQEVTYTYQKKVVTKGSFVEHHIYQTKKLDGTIVQDKKVDKIETSGTEKENYKTSKNDRAGYKLIQVTSKNGGQFNQDGSEKEAAYIADKKQEVTYIYQKEEEKPVEPVIPVKPEDPTPVTPEEPTPVVPITPVNPEEPTPVVPTTPITPEEPGKVIEKEDKPVVETKEEEKIVEIEEETIVKESVKVPRQNVSTNPKTGIASSLGIMGTLAASALAFLGLDDKKRKNK